MKRFSGKLTKTDYKSLINVYPGKQSDKKGPMLNIAKVYDQELNSYVQSMYDVIVLSDQEECVDDP